MKKTYSKNSRQGLPGGPNEMFEKVKGIIVSQRGQWDFPGMNTMVPTDDGRITMRGVPYPVYGQDETGYGQMMYPNQEYQFPGNNVLELPMAQKGLQKKLQPWEYLDEEGDLHTDVDLLPNDPQAAKKYAEELNWMRNWIPNRQPQMQSAIKSYMSRQDEKHPVDALAREYIFSPLFGEPSAYGLSNDWGTTNQELGRGILKNAVNNVNTLKFKDSSKVNPESYLPSAWGSYSPYNHSIHFLGQYPSGDTKIHEIGHGTRLAKQKVFQDVIQHNLKNDPIYKSNYDDYYHSPEEIYSRIWEIRKGLNLKPTDKVTKELLKKKLNENKNSEEYIDLFKYLKPDTIVNLLNELVYQEPDSQLPIAKRGGGLPKFQGVARSQVPTYNDSLDLYKNTVALENFLRSKKAAIPTSKFEKWQWENSQPILGTTRNWYTVNPTVSPREKALAYANSLYDIDKSTADKSLSRDNYVKTQNNLIGTRDWAIGGGDDKDFPVSYVHPKIKPQFEGDTQIPGEGMFYMYRYDPVAIKPGSLLTPKELALRLKKYGKRGIPQSKIDEYYASKNPVTPLVTPPANIIDINKPNQQTSRKEFVRNINQFPFQLGPNQYEQRVSLNTPLHTYMMNLDQYSKLLPTDSIPQQGNFLYRLNRQQLGGSLPTAQVGDEIFPGEGQYYNIPEYTYNYKRGFDDLPTPRYTGPLMNQRLIDEATQREYEQRKRAIEESVAAAREPLSTQRLARESAATGDKFSLQMNLGDPYNNPRLYETLGALDFINPGVMLGDMVTGLGSVPYNVQEGNYGAAAVGLGLPLATGALAAIGVKTPRQFINNLVNPVAGIGDTPKQLPGSSNVAPVINAARNLEDLKAAQQFAQKYGYELPANLERVAQSNEFTDRVIRGMMNRHNTFVRGVSTNWEELGKRNPEILRHLEGKGFDLSTKEGTKAAAEYMATHIPINTGYGRASLDADVFNRGMQGLYTSNSIPTAEGYTYGQGYIVSGKKPTNYSSSNRQDWINQNNTYYKDEDQFRKLMYPLSEESKDIVGLAKVPAYEKNKMEVINSVKSKMDSVQKEIEQLKKGNVKYTGESIEESITIRNKIIEDLNKDIKYLEQHGDELLKKPGEYKILRTERSNLPTDPFAFLIQKEGNAKKMSEWLKTQPYQQKMREMNDLGESLSNYTWEQQKLIRDKIDILKKEANEMYNKSVQDYMKINHPDYDPVNKYAHYIHLGVPGEKVLQPIKSWEITPEIWKNKSRRHSNKYSKKFSAMANGGILNMQRFGGNLNFQKGGIKKGGIKNLSPYGELQFYPTESGVGLSGEAGLDYQLPFGNSAYLSNSFNVEPGYGSYFNPGFGIEQPIGGNRGSFFIGAEMFDGAPRLNAGLRYRFEDGGSLPTAGDPVLNFIQRQSPRFSKSKK